MVEAINDHDVMLVSVARSTTNRLRLVKGVRERREKQREVFEEKLSLFDFNFKKNENLMAI